MSILSRRAVHTVAFGSAAVLVVGMIGVAVTAEAAPIASATYAATSTANLATVDATLATSSLAAATVGASTASTAAQPQGSTASASNLSAAVLGLGAAVQTVSQSAPPDHAAPTTGVLAAVSAPPLLTTAVVNASAQARYASATTCLAPGTPASSATTSTAALAVGQGIAPTLLTGGPLLGDVADVGAVSSTGTTSLVAAGGAGDTRAVQAQSTATVSTIDLLDNAVKIAVVGKPTLTAQATGVTATSGVTYVAPDVTVSVRGGTPTSLNAVGTQHITIDTRIAGTGLVAGVTLGLGTVTGLTNTGTSVSGSVTVLTANITLTSYVLGIGTSIATADVAVAPMSVSASGPADGVQCAVAPGAPVITSPVGGSILTTNRPPISGTATTGDTVTVTDGGGNPVCGPTPVVSGHWTCTPTTGLPNGSNTVTATDTGTGGATASAPVTFTIDAATPAAPVISTPANGAIVNNATVAFTGTGINGDTVTVYQGTTALCSALVDTTGSWHCSPTSPLTVGSHTVVATQVNPVNHLVSGPSNTVTFTTTVIGTQFTPLSPYRVLDTRAATKVGPVTGPIAAGHTITLSAEQLGLNNTSVSAVVLNLTVTQPAAAGYISAYPSDQTRPVVSTINFAKEQERAHLAIVPVASDGSVTIYTNESTQLVGDVFGYFASSLITTSGGLFHPVTPSRLLDTRPTGTPLTTGSTRNVVVAGHGGVPSSGAGAVVLNVTVARPTANGYVSAYPAGTAFHETTSNVNFVPGDLASNRVIVPLGTDGTVSFYNHKGTTPLVVDVVGYLSANGTPDVTGSQFVAIDPIRKLDSRAPGLGTTGTPLAPGTTRTVQLTGGNVPTAGTTSVVANLTAVMPTRSGYLTQFRAGTTKPYVSDVNFIAGDVVPNLVITGISATGQASIYNSISTTTNFVEDITGYFAALPI